MAPSTDLNFFVHRVNGVEYGGWYRVVAPDCIEVLAPGLMTILPLDGKSAEEASCRALEDFIRGRLRVGAPVPPAGPAKEGTPLSHICDAANAPGQRRGNRSNG